MLVPPILLDHSISPFELYFNTSPSLPPCDFKFCFSIFPYKNPTAINPPSFVAYVDFIFAVANGNGMLLIVLSFVAVIWFFHSILNVISFGFELPILK